jgi:RNA polymerase sigma factor (sigma-70 family)
MESLNMNDHQPTDLNVIVEKALTGELQAMQQLLIAIQGPIYRLTLRMLGNRGDAEDSTQEILLKVTTALSTFRGESQFLTWAYRIAINHVLAELRKNSPKTASFEDLSKGIRDGMAFGANQSEPNPEDKLQAFEVFVQCTHRMLTALDVNDRVAYVLGDLCDFSAEEASQALELSAAAFRQRLSRARLKLSGFMENECGVANASNRCRCALQVPASKVMGYLSANRTFVLHKEQSLVEDRLLQDVTSAVEELATIIRATRIFRSQELALSPPELSSSIKAMIESGRYRLLQ